MKKSTARALWLKVRGQTETNYTVPDAPSRERDHHEYVLCKMEQAREDERAHYRPREDARWPPVHLYPQQEPPLQPEPEVLREPLRAELRDPMDATLDETFNSLNRKDWSGHHRCSDYPPSMVSAPYTAASGTSTPIPDDLSSEASWAYPTSEQVLKNDPYSRENSPSPPGSLKSLAKSHASAYSIHRQPPTGPQFTEEQLSSAFMAASLRHVSNPGSFHPQCNGGSSWRSPTEHHDAASSHSEETRSSVGGFGARAINIIPNPPSLQFTPMTTVQTFALPPPGFTTRGSIYLQG